MEEHFKEHPMTGNKENRKVIDKQRTPLCFEPDVWAESRRNYLISVAERSRAPHYPIPANLLAAAEAADAEDLMQRNSEQHTPTRK
jgi:hypothetical protein